MGNFTAAARELGTTQPAVSLRVGWLEEDLGVPLFRRQHRGVALTAEGARLFEAVRDGLETIRAVVSDIRAQRTRKVLTLATDFGFAAYWMMPRLEALGQLMPDVDIRLVTSQNQFDIRGEPVDFAISFGNGNWAGCAAERLFSEQVLPLCSPAFLARHGPLETARRISRPCPCCIWKRPSRRAGCAGTTGSPGRACRNVRPGATSRSTPTPLCCRQP
ncbi:LysR family transcriptional regulator [uncultured Aquitalea sp.]|uniref:LysR family transcriptional regulator n=1 Tax=uncultured Aquitalea sp. TaxID=540272 RepID=UPI00343ED4EF